MGLTRPAALACLAASGVAFGVLVPLAAASAATEAVASRPAPPDGLEARPEATLPGARPALEEVPDSAPAPTDRAVENEEALRRAIEAEVGVLARRPRARGDHSTRSARVDALRIAAADPSLVPPGEPSFEARAWRLAAGAAESLGAHEPARALYLRAAAAGARDCATWRGLGRMHLDDGDFEAAEEAWLQTLEWGCSDPDAWRELGELYLLWRDPAAAMAALEVAATGAPDTSRAARLLARARHEARGGASPPPFEPAWSRPAERDWRAPAEQWAASLRAALPDSTRARFDALAAPGGWVGSAQVLCALIAAWIALRLLRGRGDLVVAIEYPNELRGTFSVRLATRKARYKRRRPSERGEILAGGPSSRSEHHLVGRETHFRRLPARKYYVTVEGLIQEPVSGEILTEHFEERPFIVKRRRSGRLLFDFAPRDCPLDVKVLWDKKPVKEAGVAARGMPESLRFARGDATRIALPRGRHRIAVGSGDRVVEREVDLASFQPVAIEIDLAGSEEVIFKGCPPAVEPYLVGDLATAARELEREGQDREAHLLLARMHVEEGRPEKAADHYETAGQWLEAARLRAETGDPGRAGELFARAGEAGRAAEMFAEAGLTLQAGECFEQAGDLDRAIHCYREAGESGRWMDALERRGQIFEAAQVALEKEDRARAIRLLQQVPADHPRIADAAAQLADALEQEGHAEMAAQRLGEIARQWGPEQGTPSLRDRLAGLHEKTGQLERALEVLEELRSIEPTWPNLATRIEALRKRITARSSGGRLSGSDLATTGFLGEQRYELLEEIGRGGMGVVYRARDRRLDRIVALKRLPENLRDHPKAIQLFLREAQASARLTHRNITTVYDADQEDGVFFITMELLKGQPLNRIVRKKRRLSARDAARLGLQIADGLAYAHAQGVVHRDIKTANLFFTVDHTLKIMDFGLAKMMQEVRRGATVIGGTPYYMAPEQSAGEAVDHRTDLYAFGVTLFELATGRLPFVDGDVTYHHRHTPPPDPREFVPEIPEALAELVADMLEKRPDDRIGSAEAVRARLEAIARSG